MHCRDGLSLGMGCCYHTFSSIFNSLKCSHRLSCEIMNWKGARKGLHVEPASMYCMPGSRFKFVFCWFSSLICSSIHIDHMIPAPFLTEWPLSGPTTAHCTIHGCFLAWFYPQLSQDCCSDFKHQKDGWANGAAWHAASGSCRIGVSQRYMIRMWSRFFQKGWGLLNFIEHWVLFTPLFCSCDVSRGSCC